MKEISRRTILKMAGGATLTFGFPGKILAVLQDGTLVVQEHKVPADKNLTAEWRAALFQKGEKEIWTAEALDAIGMPVGGIATGQLYLCGDGTLGCWELFNHHEYQNEGPYSYALRPIPKLAQFGFKVNAGGKTWQLDKSSFHQIQFNGTYPVGTVVYQDPSCPFEAKLIAYSPFIPLNAKDSALPATIFEVSVQNKSSEALDVDLAAFLENACSRSGDGHLGNRKRHTRASSADGITCMLHSADSSLHDMMAERPNPRNQKLLADFEGETYGDWIVEGEAFGSGPAKGTLDNQNPVSGFVGKGLVNTYYKGDGTTGKLTSPEFTIERDFINFKIGGGNQPGKECINLVVDGKVVRTSTGLNDEKLMWDTWSVGDLAGLKARIEIVDNATGGWGHINIDQISQSDRIESKEDLNARHVDANLDTGTLALSLLATGHADDNPDYGFDKPYVGEVRGLTVRLEPGNSHQAVFVLTWNFPHHPQGHNYCNLFADAEAVARYVSRNYQRLSRDTKLWRDTYYDSTLPYWLLDRLHMTAGNLATGVTEWRKNGLFWCWEGVVCCDGTCTHVWNYEHTLSRLFPDLERNIRTETDFGVGFDETSGLVGMRSDREYAADGQCGTILKAYREHMMTPDDRYLKQYWPRIKKALEFLIHHDGNGDGIIEDAQPNTYDIEFFGANTFVGSLYLGALRAGEEMATDVGDPAFADQCRTIFRKGSEATMKRLWNGEYFIQEVDESKYKQFQYGPGCLSDQLFGQGWAHQVGLGYIYPRESVVKGLQSIWKYNWAPDVAGQNKRWPPQRPFALPGEAGLFTCTWPIGGRENEPVLYRDEVWTGIEYQVAGHMVWEGLVEEGLAICRAIHERYHPMKRNPYNEVECSDHYARAMASWGVFLALGGFYYHGPKQALGFAPRITPGDFRTAFTTAEGWGNYSQRIDAGKLTARIEVAWGKVPLKQVALETESTGSVTVTRNGRKVDASLTKDGRSTTVSLGRGIVLKPGQSLEIAFA
ncbi:MAG: GH116 family glycosyl hydrolase [Fimbriimonas sp.]|nr:GH116 family glycosyl hydrolase [Fimbriimonas sp.]